MNRKLDSELLDKIGQDFAAEEQDRVEEFLLELTHSRVMAESEYNLLNSRMAILHLSEGNLKDVKDYLQAAKIDFRDVIKWSIEKSKSK